MPFSPEYRYDFYFQYRINKEPFLPARWKKPGARSTPDQRASFFPDIASIHFRLGVVAVDLGLSIDEQRKLFAAGVRAFYQALAAQPLRGRSSDALEVFFALGTCRDAAAAKRYAEAFEKTEEASSRGQSARVPQYWGLANVLSAHALGGSLDAAAKALKGAPALKIFGVKTAAVFDALKQLALHCATSKKPDPGELLLAVANAQQKEWKRDDAGNYDAYLAMQALAFGAMARDRGWKVPDTDPHPSLQFALLRGKPMKIDLDDATFTPPSAEFKKLVQKAVKESRSSMKAK